MERLKEFGIKKQNIVEWANKNMAKAQIVNNKGQITNQEKFNKALLGLMKDRFAGGMEMQANSFKGVMSTVKGVFSNSLARMMGISATGEVRVGSMFDTIKGKVKGLSKTLIKWSENGTIQRWGDIATNVFNRVAGFIENPVVPVMKDFGGFVAFELVPRLASIGSTVTDIVITAFGGMGDESTGLKTTLGDLVTGGLDLVNNGLNWVVDHKDTVVGALKGLGKAYLGYRAILFAVSIMQGIQTAAQWASVIASGAHTLAIVGLYTADFILAGATKVATAATWLFNTALTANPIGLVVTLVAGLVLGLVALYKKSDTARNAMQSFFGGMKAGAKSAINFILSGINKLISGLNKINIKFPKWLPKVGGKEFGINIPQIPMLAKGTNFFGGGQAIVGERGPELVTMPRGAKVLPNKQTKSKLTESISSEEYREDVNFAPTINIKVEGVSENSSIEETIKNVIDGELTPILENYFNRLRKKRPALTER
ncbi:hypothetical protein [Dethiothermospora halolimnae]|uniref:hypothetical protein n=1 Tax=Dethiothermospora halolimnae TaxID=3114390 RepID=UPI003CCC0BD3